MRIQLWSYNYAPEPTGIAVVSSAWAKAMVARGHDVDVVAAHPHYPSPVWGTRLRPYRDDRDGARVLRLPIWHGRASASRRMRQEATYALCQTAAMGAFPRPDAIVTVSPCFPALAPALLNARTRRLPWLLWLQDILPDAAEVTGLVREGLTLRASRRLERAAYDAATHIVVVSDVQRDNLIHKGVPEHKIDVIFNPITAGLPPATTSARATQSPRVLSIGNIGLSQGHRELVSAFQSSAELAELGVRFDLTGDGVAAPGVRDEIRSPNVQMHGIVPESVLTKFLESASLGVVALRHDGAEFSMPSRMANYMAWGIPVIAVVRPDSAVARIVRESGGGFVVDAGRPETFAQTIVGALRDPADLQRRARAARRYAELHLDQARIADRFDNLLHRIAGDPLTITLPTPYPDEVVRQPLRDDARVSQLQ